jgi:ABC-2 type transport system permease protein
VAVALTVALFSVIGPRRTRLVAQIVAAVLGAVFIVALQIAAVATYGTISSTVILQSSALERIAPGTDSLLWLGARGVLGEIPALLTLLALGAVALALAIGVFAPRFGDFAIAAASVGQIGGGAVRNPRAPPRFVNRSPRQALQRKEWALLRRDPWLASQTLMQVMYLLPAAFLLWKHFGQGVEIAALLVPVLIAAAGQLAGGLAWIAIGGEDAPELIASAPVPPARVLRAKTEAVMSALAVIFIPFVAVIALVSARAGIVALAGIVIVATTSTAIQFWFRAQAGRNRLRRRQTSSRLASVTEAMAAISFAAASGFATAAESRAGVILALVPATIGILIVFGAWMIRPSRQGASQQG